MHGLSRCRVLTEHIYLSIEINLSYVHVHISVHGHHALNPGVSDMTVPDVRTPSSSSICGPLRFPSESEVHSLPTPHRHTSIPHSFSSAHHYRQTLTNAIRGIYGMGSLVSVVVRTATVLTFVAVWVWSLSRVHRQQQSM